VPTKPLLPYELFNVSSRSIVYGMQPRAVQGNIFEIFLKKEKSFFNTFTFKFQNFQHYFHINHQRNVGF